MTIATLARSSSATALGKYLEGDGHGHDGSEDRNLHVSSLGNCAPATFLSDIRQTRAVHGKSHLEVETYHLVLSHTNEEVDPSDPIAVAAAHDLARKAVAETFPGHQARLWTQADNSRTETDAEGREVTIPGKVHTHCEIANVAESATTIRWTDKHGVAQSRRYEAGRAVDGPMKNLARVRGEVDRVVARDWQYDNAAYVAACRTWSPPPPPPNGRGVGGLPIAGPGEKVGRLDRAARVNGGHSAHDAVRVKLREARALATDWDDYTARLAAESVSVRSHAGSGASYAWVGADGVERKSRARKLGDDFTRPSVEKQCAENAAALARGEQLVPPMRIAVPPVPAASSADTEALQRPKPEYQTPNGKPVWMLRADEGLDEFKARVERDGGTYEASARAGLDAALDDDWVTDRDRLIAKSPDYGVELDGLVGESSVRVRAPDGSGYVEIARSGDLGPGYSGNEMDEWLEGKDITGDNGRTAPGGDTCVAGGTEIRRFDDAAVASLRTEGLAESARRRAEQHDKGSRVAGEPGANRAAATAGAGGPEAGNDGTRRAEKTRERKPKPKPSERFPRRDDGGTKGKSGGDRSPVD